MFYFVGHLSIPLLHEIRAPPLSRVVQPASDLTGNVLTIFVEVVAAKFVGKGVDGSLLR